jgi:hypothetical protein
MTIDKNNNFRRATDLGAFSSTQVLRAKNSIGPRDTVDVLKFTVQPTTGFRASSTFRSKGGTLNVSFFVLNPLTNQITQTAAPTTIRAGRTDSTFDFPPTDAPLTFFVRFDKPTADVNYQFRLRPLA